MTHVVATSTYTHTIAEVESKDYSNPAEEAERAAMIKEALDEMRQAYADIHKRACEQLEEVEAKIAKLKEQDVRVVFSAQCSCDCFRDDTYMHTHMCRFHAMTTYMPTYMRRSTTLHRRRSKL